ncbi:unknown [Clostridium sp. CAG:277]|nr:unknown [Clostridium sp. CAG:277]
MEEKNQDTQDTNQYTGEYGNPMEKSEDTVKPAGEEQSSSVYSYSYRDHKPEATSSGDYHASENASSAGAAQSRQVQRKAPPVRRHSRRKHQVMPMQRHRKRIVMAGPLWGTSR